MKADATPKLREAVYLAPRGKTIDSWTLWSSYLDPDDASLAWCLRKANRFYSGCFRLELTNDDENVNIRPLPLIRICGPFRSHTYHVDVQFEMACAFDRTGNSVRTAVLAGRR